MPKPLEIAIVGAGPAGMAAALLLQQSGNSITIFERFEKPSPVGSGLLLQPTGLSVLAHLGLLDRIMALGSRIDQLSGRDARSGRTVLDVRYAAIRGGRFGLGVHRAALFDTLHSACLQAGLRFVTGWQADAVISISGKAELVGVDGEKRGPFDLVIDASGARSALVEKQGVTAPARDLAYGAFWATLSAAKIDYRRHALDQRYDRAEVMLGVLPVGRDQVGGSERVAFFWSQKVADAENVKALGLDAWKRRVFDYWPDIAPLVDQIDSWDQLTLARYRHRTLKRPFGERLAFIGDAAHSTSPQLGQGANMALLDAAVLAACLAEHADLSTALASYGAMRRNHVRLFQALSLVFTPFYQSDSHLIAFVRDQFVATLAHVPPIPALLAAIVSGTLANPLKPAGLIEVDWHRLGKS